MKGQEVTQSALFMEYSFIQISGILWVMLSVYIRISNVLSKFTMEKKLLADCMFSMVLFFHNSLFITGILTWYKTNQYNNNQHLVSVYYVPGIGMITLHALFHSL